MRLWMRLVLGAWLAIISNSVRAEYPERLITLIVAVPAGGAGDLVARQFASRLSEVLKQNVVVENRGGAAGTIATSFTARAAADGYTLLLSSIATHSIAPAVYKNITYDPSKDFSHIGLIATAPAILSVNSALPIHSVADLVNYARARPAELNFGSSGTGSGPQLWGEMFMGAAGVKLTHVPYKGSAPAVVDLLAGRVQMMFDAAAAQVSGIQTGQLRPLAVLDRARSSFFPEVPTMAEAGYPSVTGNLWYGLSGPAKLPPDIVARLQGALQKIAAMPDFQEALKQVGFLSTPTSPQAYSQFILDENDKYRKIARAADVTVE
ncbi:Bug family tripartite tricarboxylate transporter substrate binding protein [Bradyrhizobium erythrophlei]|jgi:tripartite-type tricarboxylate transporter receptor subunit TctC|uniref:Tripartite-type tricarboxylate transporter, receptor component TctC n=1 Tax=Bradyrhizobium erythrophlei TaxID=1437360 RepID=A0A1M7UDU5_9BRAD|nr:tripartite tricarboxylate transporter substrate binding protein [Bradyrhizobium erythrophlei]SHN81203.1 Tripartite-type tricarboxylate transporter, receptor component TctC [Bradyrhizobium erythrophlei]